VARQEPIKKVTLADGRVRWRFVVDVGKKPDGRRDQRTYTYDTLKQARDERARIVSDLARGSYIRDSKRTVDEHLTEWLDGRRNVRESTRANYVHALKPVREQLGHIELQKLTKGHVDRLVTGLLATGRRVGNVGKPLSPRTVTLTLTVLGMALEDAVKQGVLVRNVARLVDRPAQQKRETATWTAAQAASFLAYTAVDRLSVAWQLSLYGLRRGELLGLRWADVDLVAGTLTVAVSRVIVDGRVIEVEPKTERGKRTLPLVDAGLVDALTALQLRQREEADAAGSAYGSCPDCGQVHVVADELGDPVHPESYSDRFEVLVRKSGLPAIRLHDCRHTAGTLMHLKHVPTAAISAWLGHASASFTMGTYVHSQDDALRAAGAVLTTAYSTTEESP
jgi:integrase